MIKVLKITEEEYKQNQNKYQLWQWQYFLHPRLFDYAYDHQAQVFNEDIKYHKNLNCTDAKYISSGLRKEMEDSGSNNKVIQSNVLFITDSTVTRNKYGHRYGPNNDIIKRCWSCNGFYKRFIHDPRPIDGCNICDKKGIFAIGDKKGTMNALKQEVKDVNKFIMSTYKTDFSLTFFN